MACSARTGAVRCSPMLAGPSRRPQEAVPGRGWLAPGRAPNKVWQPVVLQHPATRAAVAEQLSCCAGLAGMHMAHSYQHIESAKTKHAAHSILGCNSVWLVPISSKPLANQLRWQQSVCAGKMKATGRRRRTQACSLQLA